MRRYPSYKKSPVELLPSLPSHWELVALKHACRIFPSNVDKHTIEGETPIRLCNYTDVYYEEQIDSSLDLMSATATEQEIEKFRVTVGDVVFTKDSETADDIGIAAYVTETLPGTLYGYHLSIARPNEGVCGRYVKRLFDSRLAKSYFETRANGLTRVGLGQKAVEMLPFPLPPLAEQQAIAAFLDRETAKIDALVEEQRRLIALLQEKRQADISHAVTKGLDPTAKLKPSGIDWLGDIPAHWDCTRLKFATTSIQTGPFGSQLHASDYVSGGTPMINPAHIEFEQFNPAQDVTVDPSTAERLKEHRLELGDIVIARRGEMGRCAVALEGSVGWLCGTGSLNIRVRQSQVTPEFLAEVIRTPAVRSFLSLASVGSTMDNLNSTILGEVTFGMPPLEEQERIIEVVARAKKVTDALTAEATRAIALLQERRAALISAAVTGKIDVRDALSSDQEAA